MNAERTRRKHEGASRIVSEADLRAAMRQTGRYVDALPTTRQAGA